VGAVSSRDATREERRHGSSLRPSVRPLGLDTFALTMSRHESVQPELRAQPDRRSLAAVAGPPALIRCGAP
jgi:hypothetical protein